MDDRGNFVVYVNKREVRVTGAVLDASEILTFAGFSPDEYSLFLVPRRPGGGAGPGQSGGGAGPGQSGGGAGPVQIMPGQTVEIRDGLQFHAILRSVPYG